MITAEPMTIIPNEVHKPEGEYVFQIGDVMSFFDGFHANHSGCVGLFVYEDGIADGKRITCMLFNAKATAFIKLAESMNIQGGTR